MTFIPLDQLKGQIWWNDLLVDWQDAKLHFLTHSLHYSGSVFEGIRVYNGKAFKLNEHNTRLINSSLALGYKIKYSVEELNSATEKLINCNNITNGYVRPLVWRGSEDMKVSGSNSTTHVAIAVWASFKQYDDEKINKGLNLEIARWKKAPADCGPHNAKSSSSYMILTMVKNDSLSRGFDDALMLDIEGNITEATTSNFFIIKDEALFTPIPSNFLDGITRQTIIDIALSLNVKVVESKLTLSSLIDAQSAFLTGTAIEIQPISTIHNYIDNKTHQFETNNKLLLELIHQYRKLANS